MIQWGPADIGGGRWRFALWAPDRQSVSLEIEGGATLPMEPADDGWFCVETRASEDSHYRFRLAPDLAVPDPASRRQAGGVHGWSVVTPISPPATGWTGRPWEDRKSVV